MLDLLLMLAVFAGAFAIGYALISRVPPMLHTPLMSMTNAISAVTVLGALLLFAVDSTPVERVLAVVAVAAAMFNVTGGFVITNRMLGLFRKKESTESGG
jgi:H+-translocating NAD(P) transhydrogenase subunit alpha